ncbi:hypothetical protein [Lentimicrobium sp. S6]|uniref:hypothetical protein n=1 Tax=Lentimicrobium sp. S6 TaxID=2735872 RepID=UPI001556E05F|nr:hypothetical protein [Lentimicrobium sp. S6]NPD47736.1 hypothetical protein [Lentimicrobium sp. S6]
MHTGDYNKFVHEIKRAIGLSEVSWQSVMESLGLVYTTEDKKIGQFEAKYHTSTYEHNKTQIDINTITETIPIPAAARSHKSNFKTNVKSYNQNMPTTKYNNAVLNQEFN